MDKKEYYDMWLRGEFSCVNECRHKDLCKSICNLIIGDLSEYVSPDYKNVENALCLLMRDILYYYNEDE